jgi:F-type H+-transporting ATPase subunit b
MFLLPHLGTIIWLVIIFSLVLYILTKFAWKPLLKALDERQSTVELALKSAETAQNALNTIAIEQQKLLETAKAEKEKLIKDAFIQRDKILLDAQQKADLAYAKMIDDAKRNIEREKKAAQDEVKNQIAMLSVEIATLLIKGDLKDKLRHEKLVNELISEVNIN